MGSPVSKRWGVQYKEVPAVSGGSYRSPGSGVGEAGWWGSTVAERYLGGPHPLSSCLSPLHTPLAPPTAVPNGWEKEEEEQNI